MHACITPILLEFIYSAGRKRQRAVVPRGALQVLRPRDRSRRRCGLLKGENVTIVSFIMNNRLETC